MSTDADRYWRTELGTVTYGCDSEPWARQVDWGILITQWQGPVDVEVVGLDAESASDRRCVRAEEGRCRQRNGSRPRSVIFPRSALTS